MELPKRIIIRIIEVLLALLIYSVVMLSCFGIVFLLCYLFPFFLKTPEVIATGFMVAGMMALGFCLFYALPRTLYKTITRQENPEIGRPMAILLCLFMSGFFGILLYFGIRHLLSHWIC